MARAADILLTDNELFIDPNTGDLAIGPSDTQHVRDIINSWAGWWKEFPTLGVGINRYLGRPGGVQIVKRAIQIHMSSDGYRTDRVIVDGNKIYVTGERIVK